MGSIGSGGSRGSGLLLMHRAQAKLIVARCCHVTAGPQRTTNRCPKTFRHSRSPPLANSSNRRCCHADCALPESPADVMPLVGNAAGSLDQALRFEARQEAFHLRLHLS
ncbi:hypothetical protein StoSoilB19_31040 [Arthrobacter sp. StoSoilB19]|nr:hypothetical protein StoSoilB19_31040 [Arthrobacter sp. StoSoilB19]